VHPERLQHDYVPPNLPRREDERKEMYDFFYEFFEKKARFISLSLVGNAGVGKTVLSRRVGEDIEQALRPYVRTLYVNCYMIRNPFKALVEIVRKITPSIPRRGLSLYEVMDSFLKILHDMRCGVLIILDEIDMLFKDKAERARDMLYMLSRTDENDEWRRLNISIGIITTSRNEVWPYKWLDSATRASFIKKVHKLNDYSKDDLFEILRYRAELALRFGSYNDEILEFIADYTAQYKNGNARIAIDLLAYAAEIAEMQKSSEILPEHVRRAINDLSYARIDINVDPEVLYSLGRHKLIVLLSIIRALKITNKAYITRRELQPFYQRVCEEYGEKPRRTTQLLKYIKELGTELGTIMSVEVSGKGQRGRSTRISINVELDLLEKTILPLIEQ